MENMLIRLVFGHFIADFFFQSKAMTDNKYLPGLKGFLWCSIHVLVYTFFVAIFVGNFSLFFLLGVYIPHWIMDRWSLAHHWMKFLGKGDLINSLDSQEVSFGVVVYVVIDQTIHLGCLYVLINLI